MYQGDSLKRTLLLDSPDQASLSIPREEELRSLGSGDWGKQKSTNCLLDSETVSLCSEETLGGGVCQGLHVFIHGLQEHQASNSVKPSQVSVSWFPVLI